MRTRRRSRALAMTAICALALSGCSISKGFALGGDAVPKSALCPGKPVSSHITVVDWWDPNASPGLLKSAQDFNCEHPDIAVNISIVPSIGDDGNGKLLAAVAAGKPPDITLSWDDPMNAWAAKGEIQPLDELAAKYGIVEKDFVPDAWKSTFWGGHMYGIPVDWDPDAMLWYNKKVFKDAGLDPDKPPTTWKQLQDYAAKIDQVKNGKIKRLGFVPWAGWQFNYIQMGHQAKADFQNGQDPKVVLDSPGLRQVMQYNYDVAKKFGGSSKVNSFTTVAGAEGSAADALLSGRLGMELIGDWEIGQQLNVGKKVFRETLGVTAMPPPPGGQQYLCHSGWSFMFPTGAKHTEAAMKFVTWIQEPAHFAKYLGTTLGWLPARNETRSQDYLTSDPTWRKVIEIDQKAGRNWWLPPSPILQQYYHTLDQSVAAIISLQKTPDKALREAQDQVEAALENAVALGFYE